MTDLDLPHFSSEAEEADWWFEHRHQVEANFVLAANKRLLTRRESPAEPTPTSASQIAVEPGDADLALAQARRKGLSFEDHTRSLFHRAVQAEEHEHAS